jgi:anti-anti-sigma factor
MVQSRPSAYSPEVRTVLPEGRLDASAAPELQQVLTALEGQGVTRVVLNFCLTHYISSSSLRVMILHSRRLQQAGGGLAVCCMPKKVANVLCITGLDVYFRCFPSEEDAARACLAPPPGPEADTSDHER